MNLNMKLNIKLLKIFLFLKFEMYFIVRFRENKMFEIVLYE